MTNTTPDETKVSNDSVNHPSHYTQYPVEVIQLTEHMDFCRGNAVKYLARAGFKDPSKELEDLKKASWYTLRAISKLEAEIAEAEAQKLKDEAPWTAGIWKETSPVYLNTVTVNASNDTLYFGRGGK